VTVEAAVVYPIMLLLLLGLIVVGMGVFHHQQVAWQAREASRFASVRGWTWEKDTDQPSPTKNEILRNVMHPLAFTMDRAKLNLQVSWVNQATGEAVDWDSAPRTRFSVTKTNEYVVNTVRVTVTYEWMPELFLVGPIYLVSTSEFPMGS
jgi:Flp pilus assembly protein TadG